MELVEDGKENKGAAKARQICPRKCYKDQLNDRMIRLALIEKGQS